MGPESGDFIESPNDEQWLVVSSNDETYDSDRIESDIEAELYSIIHHKADTSEGQDVSDINLHSQNNMSSSKLKNKNFELKDSSDSDIHFASPTKKTPLKAPNIKNERLKRKSDLIAGILENIQSKKPAKNKKKVDKSCTDSKQKQKSNFKKKSKLNSAVDRTPVVESSDSDSVIYIDLDSSEVKTNIGHDTVSLSSDSESSVLSEGSDSFRISNFRNTSLPNLSLTENSNVSDPWHIDADDLYRNKKHSNRYHDRALLKCSNCDLKGHSAKFCSVPKAVKCYICGGDHVGFRCKSKLCFKCHKAGHDPRFCYKQDIDMCHLCNMRGHFGRDCPDLWRRYHLTTRGIKVIPGRHVPQDCPVFCFNCGQVGHYGSICQGPRLERWAFPTWTSVINYEHPSRSNDVGNVRFAAPNRNASFFPQMQANFTPSKFLTPKQRKKLRKKKKKSPNSEAASLPGSSKKKKKQPEDFPRTKKKDLKTKQLEHLQGLRRRLGQIPTMSV